jgi:predicted RNA-binding Zn ribbon-like protein
MRCPGSLLRLGLAVLAVSTLAILAVVLARVDLRLGDQARANRQTRQASGSIVEVNARMSSRLGHLAPLVDETRATVEATSALTPVLEQLRAATVRANRLAAEGRGGAAATRESLDDIRRLVAVLEGQLGALGQSSQGVLGQQRVLTAVLGGLADDLDAALADARRIRRLLDAVLPA